MKIRTTLTSLAVAATVACGFAVPAKPGLYTFTQPDGSVVEASLIGDEHFHYYRTPAGMYMLRDADGYLREASIATINTRMAKARAATAIPGEISRTFPTTGTVRGLIIMAEFQDVKFLEKTTREYIDKKVNSENYVSDEAAGSVIDYFREQSGGLFTPEFDVVGPVTLPQNRSYYGESEDLVSFYRDACVAADTQTDTDFSKYDANNDGFVDFVFVIFPGHGEAQGGPVECIWPAMIDLSNHIYDYFDGMNIKVAACACELKGNSGEDWDGVGTICHEFSHILGLPDVYDAKNSGGYGMGHFDLMDVGPYNGDGRLPAGYTAMDRYTLGWLEPEVLEESATGLQLEPLIGSNKAYFIVNPDNKNEYYTLENRQLTGFDSGLPGHGMVVSLIHYEKEHWSRNTVNSPSVAGYEHIELIAADNEKLTTDASEAADPFPGTKNVTSFGDNTTLATKWRSTVNKEPGFSIKNISEGDNGIITFDFVKANTGTENITDDGMEISGGKGYINAPAEARIFSIDGSRVNKHGLEPGIYVVCLNGRSVKVLVK